MIQFSQERVLENELEDPSMSIEPLKCVLMGALDLGFLTSQGTELYSEKGIWSVHETLLVCAHVCFTVSPTMSQGSRPRK